jgi:hypothetical protein
MHVIHFLALGTGREYFQETLEQVFGLEIILLVIVAIGEFVIEVFEALAALKNGEQVFVELLGVVVLLLGIVLFRHPVLVFIVIALQNLSKLRAGTDS